MGPSENARGRKYGRKGKSHHPLRLCECSALAGHRQQILSYALVPESPGISRPWFQQCGQGSVKGHKEIRGAQHSIVLYNTIHYNVSLPPISSRIKPLGSVRAFLISGVYATSPAHHMFRAVRLTHCFARRAVRSAYVLATPLSFYPLCYGTNNTEARRVCPLGP
jgi:hypothetical protein